MSNDCCGILRVVAKKKKTLKRIFDILNYDDDEFCLYRCKDVSKCGSIEKDGDYYVQDFNVDGAWECGPFFTYGDRPKEHLSRKKPYEEGEEITEPAHFTDLCHLAKVLDFGCELWCCESGCEFEQHFLVTHDGELVYSEHGKYELKYPMIKNEDGEDEDYDYEAEPEEYHELGDYGEYSYADEIYGDVTVEKE